MTTKSSKPIGKTDKPNSPVVKPNPDAICYWNGQAYSSGSTLCVPDSNGMQWQYICGNDGNWVNSEILCNPT